jgi:purine-binding chemotaxis protein CheW
VIPAINLRQRFGFPKAPYDLRTRLIVVRAGGRTVGLIVDNAREFVPIAGETIQPPPEGIAGLSGHYLSGIATLGERLALILDIEAVISQGEALPNPA